jgi:beta-phosphoglucomutase-like phosphatase (HAD superfamily)
VTPQTKRVPATDACVHDTSAPQLWAPPRPPQARRCAAESAIAAGVKVAVCSTSSEKAVQTIVDAMLGTDIAKVIRVFAGDIVAHKKPDPEIYTLAATALGVPPDECASSR